MEGIIKIWEWCPQHRITKSGSKWSSRTKRNKESEVGKQDFLSARVFRFSNHLW